MGMGFAPTWLRQVSPPTASHDHFNHCSGSLCLRTLHLRRLYGCFDENLRRICFGNLIRTLYCSLFGLLRPVVLEVIT